MMLKSLVAAAVFALAGVAHADQWTDADDLFAQREAGRAKVAEARAKYETILNTTTSVQDKIRAYTQLGRLAAYEGEMLLPKTAKAEREAIFEKCWKTYSAKVAPGAIGQEAPQYYYYKGVCLAWWGEAVGALRSLPQVPEMKAVMNKALTLDTRFEGGGAHRLAAGVKSNPFARALPGLYDIAEAERQIGLALESAAYPGDEHNGKAYYENLRGQTQVLVEAGKKVEAKAKFQEGIALIERAVRTNRLPKGREPESKWVLGKLKLELEELD